ncbi:MAG: ECF transporter S component [Firmicutes bacterium]|nr:ECF transporter S component [Dethiobacter sp.]MBS3889219.1 ECF transporter S component [Bacillota bacterium]MBS4053873.1 ECF transporter S component [Thermaerobacter sp.]
MKVTLNELLKAALMIAIGVVLPIAFHALGWTGRVFLPMHIPVLLAGFILGPWLGVTVGATTPLLSSLLTGMPPMAPMPIALQMSVELAAFGLLAGVLYTKLKLHIVPSLLLTLVGGRFVFSLVTLAVFPLLGLRAVPLAQVFGASLVMALPGLALQLVAVPATVLILQRHGQARQK